MPALCYFPISSFFGASSNNQNEIKGAMVEISFAKPVDKNNHNQLAKVLDSILLQKLENSLLFFRSAQKLSLRSNNKGWNRRNFQTLINNFSFTRE